jgi:hypothetical protein
MPSRANSSSDSTACGCLDYDKVVREQYSPDGKYYACWRDPNYPYCFIVPLEV